ncbi:MAG TPA: DUF3604 domain-containing protein [Candidatus Solibacter sp.]|nr:DUF3604 domain-containing protein [Candidatus Solibacter sp.]
MFTPRMVIIVAIAAAASAQGPVSVRVLLGATDTESKTWDGGVRAQGANIVTIEPWRFEGADALDGNRWRMSTHEARRFGGGNQPVAPVVANGIILTLAGPNATLDFETAQGNFQVRTDELSYGRFVSKLDGRVLVDRIPVTNQVARTPEEEDYPSAAAGREGNVWMAYVAFKHHPRYNQLRQALSEPLQDFERLKEPTGGDQVLLRKYSGGTWGPALAITEPGLDLYRTAVAIDGKQRTWVFWSQNNGGNFDIFARSVTGGSPGPVIQISKDAGSDIDPVAAANAQGTVWVAWQGWRNGRARIFAASLDGDRFTAPSLVSQSAGNEWNPAIAAAPDGRVTVAWDSYRNGNYDIFMRTASGRNSWGAEAPVAVTARYEAYPSIAYDSTGRLWVAYEEGGSGWGKDFGAYNTSGIALYQGRAIRLVGFERAGGRVETQADPGGVLPGAPDLRVNKPGLQTESEDLDPDREIARNRRPAGPAQNKRAARNSYPRLTVDASGRLWLAFRSAYPVWWTQVGTVWTEHLTSYDGSSWSAPIYLHHSDNLLDNRPALASTAAGSVMVMGASDGRREFRIMAYMNLGPNAGRAQLAAQAAPDPYNNDLYSTEVSLGPAPRAAAVKPSTPRSMAGGPDAAKDAAAVKRLRDYRAGPERIVRGEFHRHSDISADGGNDGSLIDQWRYILDTGALDWVGCCDHDNGNGREYTWWTEQKLTDIFHAPGVFVSMFAYERSVAYPEGHRNVIFAQRGIRPLPRLPITAAEPSVRAPDTKMLYDYLKHFDGIAASHTSGTNMGTDWRDNDPRVEPAVEIYQGDRQNYEMPDAPRSNSENDSIGGWRPKGFVDLALQRGYVLGFEASSDHVSTHMSYCNLYVKDLTRESILDAFKKRHIYAATDNIVADVRSGEHMMGDVFTTASLPSLRVKLAGTAKFAKVHIIRDNAYVYSTQPGTSAVQFSWVDNAAAAGKTSYYYVRGEQEDGEIVWASPMWITYSPKR